MVPANDFRKVSFTSPEQPDKRWLDWFRDEFARHFSKVDYETSEGSALCVQAAVRTLPGVAVFHGRLSPMRVTYLSQRAANDDIVLLLPPDAGMSVNVRDSDIVLDRYGGAIVANDVSNEVTFGPASNLTSIWLDRRRLAPLVPRLSDLAGGSVLADSQSLRLLRNYVRSLDEVETVTTPEARHMVATHLRDLAALAIGATRDGVAEAQGGARAARLAAVKADIVANIAGRDITLEKLAARHRISPRYIGSLFAAAGTTFTDFVLGQRLAHAHRRLTDPRFAGRAISTIAYDSGFGDLSYFNHTFRRRYGARPSDVRAEHRLAS